MQCPNSQRINKLFIFQILRCASIYLVPCSSADYRRMLYRVCLFTRGYLLVGSLSNFYFKRLEEPEVSNCNPGNPEAKAGESWVQNQPGLHRRPYFELITFQKSLKKKRCRLGCYHSAFTLSYFWLRKSTVGIVKIQTSPFNKILWHIWMQRNPLCMDHVKLDHIERMKMGQQIYVVSPCFYICWSRPCI